MPFDRRRVLLSGAATLLAPACKKEEKPAVDDAPPPDQASGRKGVEVALVSAARRILPSDGNGPGAQEAGVGAYVVGLLDDPAAAQLKSILMKGGDFLHRAAKNRGAKTFADLDAAAQDQVLQDLLDGKMRPNRFSGPRFVQVLTAVCLEGYLCDPRRGGNKDKVAWTWLGYDPKGRGAVYE